MLETIAFFAFMTITGGILYGFQRFCLVVDTTEAIATELKRSHN